MMTDEEILFVARDFREGVLAGRDSYGMCAMVCLPLAGLLNYYGVAAEVIASALHHNEDFSNHLWIRLPDGRVLDPTADQFEGLNLPPVYLGPPLAVHGGGEPEPDLSDIPEANEDWFRKARLKIPKPEAAK